MSEMRLAWQRFVRDRVAFIALGVLGLLYALTLFADVIAPYTLRDESRLHTYCPPSALHVLAADGSFSGLYVRGVAMHYDE